MKTTTQLLLFVFFFINTYASNDTLEISQTKNNFINNFQTAGDTSGIYISQTDFMNHVLHCKTNRKIRIRPFPIVNNFTVNEEAAPLKVRLPDGQKKVLNPNSFYGFKTEGAKFIYINYLNEYVSVLNDEPPFYLFVRKKVHFSGIAAFADETFWFSTNLNDSLKEFTAVNIETVFGRGSSTTKTLTELMTKMKQEGFDIEMHKKQFFQCRALVKDYFSKIMWPNS